MLPIDTDRRSKSPTASNDSQSRKLSPVSAARSPSGIISPTALESKNQVSAVSRIKAAAVWTYPEGYLDARYQFPFAEERFFKMFFDKGVFKAIFNPPEMASIQSLAFRTHHVPPELKAKLIEVRDDANYRGVSVDDEQIRMLVNDEFRMVKKSAEEELLLNQTKTAGVPIFNQIQSFVVPIGCIKNWGRGDPDSYAIVAKPEELSAKELSLSSTARRMSNAGERRSSTLKGLVGGGGKSPGKKSSVLFPSGQSLDTNASALITGDEEVVDDLVETTPMAISKEEYTLSNKTNDRIVGTQSDINQLPEISPQRNQRGQSARVDETASNQANDQLSDQIARPDVARDEDDSSQDSDNLDSHTHPQQQAQTFHPVQSYPHPHPHHKPKTTRFTIDKKYLAGKSADKLIRERSGYVHSQQELMDLRKKCDCYPFNFGCVVLQDAPEGDGVGYSYRLFYYCQANDICRKKLIHFELDKTHWDATEDVVVTHIRQQHWQQLLQTRHV